MKNRITLEEAIQGALQFQTELGYAQSTLIVISATYRRLLKLSNKRGDTFLNDDLINSFLSDCFNSKTGEYLYAKYKEHDRCIRYLKKFIESGNTLINRAVNPTSSNIADGFKKPFKIYDEHENASGLSDSSLTKNRQPVRYLLEHMTNLGYNQLSDIKPGDTLSAIQEMLVNHYSPSSLITAISGLRRFYGMFDELYSFRLEIPTRIPRKREIIDIYTKDEQDKIYNCLMANRCSLRDTAICLLSFETGMRGVDICNLKLDDIDWKHDIIHIIQSKTQRKLNLPLRSSYGNAIMNYILNERPKSDFPYIFLSVKTPHSKLNITWGIVKKAVEKAGINTDGRLTGTRMFRHNAASTMVRKGIPLPVIAEELGHKSQDSTMVYISTDHQKLSLLTLPLPKGGQSDE